MERRIYADNAATSFPKPPEVLAAMTDYAQRLGASAGRGAYREAVETGEVVHRCRQRLARLFNAEDARCIIFGLNCSEMLNLVMRGWLEPGDHVVTTRMEHNSILRPMHVLEAAGITATFVAADPRTGRVDPADLERALQSKTRLLSAQHGSNVTGTLQPIEEVARLARAHNVPLLVDAAQSAGHVPIDVQALGIDFLAFPGHKGLLGPLGTGGLYIRPGLEKKLRPLVTGGTGSVSELPVQPEFMPDKFESGSHNAIGLAGLSAGVQWLLDRGIDALRRHELSICSRFLERTADIPGLTVFGPRDVQQRVAVFSVRIGGLEPAELAAILEADFAILSRAGLHCAPWAHSTIETDRSGGTTRLSFGPFTTLDDVDRCADALAAIAAPAPTRS